MTWLIAIDESGNLGSDSRFFSMAAIITRRVRSLEPVFKKIPTKRDESKFYNSTESEIYGVLSSLMETDTIVVHIVVDKYDYTSIYYDKRGNDLYRSVLRDLLDRSLESISGHDTTVFLDRSRFVSLDELQSMARKSASSYNCNIIRCEKQTSHQNKCIQVADYVVGAINRYYENGDERFVPLLSKKISFARKN